MAKLSARGRTEVVRAMRETDTPRSDLTCWERHTRVLMSDGTILEKLDVRFKPDGYGDPRGHFHSYGYKLRGKLKAGVTATDFAALYRKHGWTIETDRSGEAYSRDRAGRLLNGAA